MRLMAWVAAGAVAGLSPGLAHGDPLPRVGVWEWERSYGGFSGDMEYTPESSGYTQQLVFNAGRVDIYRDGQWVESTVYSFNGARLTIELSESRGHLSHWCQPYTVTGNMELNESCLDGFVHFYGPRQPLPTAVEEQSWGRIKSLYAPGAK